MAEHTSTVSVPVSEHAQSSSPDIFAPDLIMLVLTWVTFFSLLFILQKFAWRPILAGLKKREETIRLSLDQADQIKSELAGVQTSKEKILSDAHRNAQEIIEQSRKRAQDIARAIEEKAKQQAQDLVQVAHQEIEGEKERLKVTLRRDSADLAVALAGKIMEENLDNEKNRKLVDRYIKEI